MRGLLSRAVLAMAAAGGLALAAAATPDPVIGSWELNIAKSKFTTGPVLKSQSRTYSQSGDSIAVVIKHLADQRLSDSLYQGYPVFSWDKLHAEGL